MVKGAILAGFGAAVIAGAAALTVNSGWINLPDSLASETPEGQQASVHAASGSSDDMPASGGGTAAPVSGDSAPARGEAGSRALAPGDPGTRASVAGSTPPPATADAPPRPRFDLVRADPDGTTVVAGSAAPGSEVTLLVDGAARETAVADRDGRFVLFADLTPEGIARVLTLASGDGAGRSMSEEEVIIAPAAPQLAAAPQAGPAPQPRAATDAAAPEGVATSLGDPAAAGAPADAAMPTDDMTGAEPPQPAAGADPTVLVSGPEGVEVLPSSPLGPSEVALDAVGYDAEGEVFLSGRGTQSAFLRVYLDNTPVTTSRIGADGGWRVALPEVQAGTYTLRIDQLDESGEVTARVESPFQREARETLANATGGAQDPIRAVTVQPGDTLWAISRDRYGEGLSYVRVFRANSDQIRDPDLIYPGQVFTLPEGE